MNLVVTDPPYNVAYESADGKKIQNDSMADEQFYSFLLSAFRNMAAHMAEGGSAYIFHADTEGLNFRMEGDADSADAVRHHAADRPAQKMIMNMKNRQSGGDDNGDQRQEAPANRVEGAGGRPGQGP